MRLFKRDRQNQASTQKYSASVQSSFILEPILTPTVGIDGVDGFPDLEIVHLPDHPLPTIELADHHVLPTDSHAPVPIDLSIDTVDQPLAVEAHTITEQPLEFLTAAPAAHGLDAPLFDSGFFTVGESGIVDIDYLFDGGGYQGELAVFSLSGMEKFEPGSPEFIHEAARRALSDSSLGHVVISDATDGARFHSALAGEGDQNSGEYQGVRSFQMRPGDTLGFMLVPNGEVKDALSDPGIGGDHRPLFSMASANPESAFHTGQIADVTGDGNTFVFEDLRVDGTTDLDYNDVIFQVRGATGTTISLDSVIDHAHDWRTTEMGKALVAYTEPYITPEPNPLTSGFASNTGFFDTSLPEQFEFPRADQPIVGVIDTGFSSDSPYINYGSIISGLDRVDGDTNSFAPMSSRDEHGTKILGIIGATQDYDFIEGVNDDAPLWVGQAVGSGQWAESLIEFVDAAVASRQPNAIANLSFDLTQINPDGSETTRFELTPREEAAIEYARQHDVLIVASAGNEGGAMSALGQAAQKFDNILTVGAAQDFDPSVSYAQGLDRANYSSYGTGLGLLADGGTEDSPVFSTAGDSIEPIFGTSVATAKVTGAASLVWAANPELSYQQIIEILKSTAADLNAPNWDDQTGAGLLNIAAAVHLAKATTPKLYTTPAIPLTNSGLVGGKPTERSTATTFMGKQYDWEQYTIRRGDTLSAIALSTMGNGSAPYYNFIAQRNGIANPNVISPGRSILIPKLVRATTPPPPPPVRWGQVSPRVGPVPLNFRSSAQVGNNKIGELLIGTQFQIIRELSGGAYSPSNRTNWYEIEANGRRGFVAAYFVDLVSQQNPGNPSNPGNPPGNSGQRILDAVNCVNPDQRYYRPRDITGDRINETFCNWFAADVLELLGIRLPANGTQLMDKPHPLYGNQNHSKPLGTPGLLSHFQRGNGWRAVSAADAVARANEGKAVVASSSGHIAVVIPGGSGSNVRIAQAGATNGKNMSVSTGFGSIRPLYFEYIR